MFSDSECRVVFKAINIYRGLLVKGGPKPLDRNWFNGEREYQAGRLDGLLSKIGKQGSTANQASLTVEEKGCMKAGLEIAHVFYSSARILVEKTNTVTRYKRLKDIQNCIFKLS